MVAGDVRENRANLKRISELVDEIREALDKERTKKRNTDDGSMEVPPSSLNLEDTTQKKGAMFKRVTVREKEDRRRRRS